MCQKLSRVQGTTDSATTGLELPRGALEKKKHNRKVVNTCTDSTARTAGEPASPAKLPAQSAPWCPPRPPLPAPPPACCCCCCSCRCCSAVPIRPPSAPAAATAHTRSAHHSNKSSRSSQTSPTRGQRQPLKPEGPVLLCSARWGLAPSSSHSSSHSGLILFFRPHGQPGAEATTRRVRYIGAIFEKGKVVLFLASCPAKVGHSTDRAGARVRACRRRLFAGAMR